MLRHELALPFLAVLAWNWWRERRFPFTTALVGFGVGGAYLLFRVWYYADLFPNTFYLKDGTQLFWGLTYLHDTLVVYGVYVLAPVLLILALLLRKRGEDIAMGQRLLLLAMAAVVGAYVIKIGGDGRHYRYLAFPFCLAACASAGLPERALAIFAPRLRGVGVTAVGIVLALVFASFHPRQLSGHPLSGNVQEQRVGVIRDAQFHRGHEDLSFSPWGSGRELEFLNLERSRLLYEVNGWPPPERRVWLREAYARHRTDGPSVHRPETRFHDWCVQMWQLFNLRMIHDDGLTDPILARTRATPWRPGHFKDTDFLASQLAYIQTLYGWGRGTYRRAVEDGVAHPWIARNLESIEQIERKVYNRHDLIENLVLAVTPIARLEAPPLRPPRHVILISLDTTRADHFGFMGNREVKTPTLDALARESVVMVDFTSAAPSTLASHTTLFTGQYPNRHGVARNGYRVNDLNRMLPEILEGYGFHTAGFVSAFVLSNRFNFAQGFDHYDQYFDQLISESQIDYVQRSAASTTDAAIRYLEDLGVPERLFLFVHYFDPHQPYAAPRSFVEMYDPSPDEPLPGLADLAKPSAGNRSARQASLERYAQRYASEISYMDREVGRLIAYLRKAGILDDAVFVVTSDHGENFWEHDVEFFFQHAAWVYQTTVHSVGMIRLPDARNGGARLTTPSSNIDILPTVLDLLGAPLPNGIDGRALDLMGDRSTRDRQLFGQATAALTPLDSSNKRNARFVREGKYKLIQTPYMGAEALYDLESDPAETENLLSAPTEEVEETARQLRRALEGWIESADPLPSTFEGMENEDTIRKLRSLGYLK
jgi:arylsulfatase A-like enzyme